MNYKNIMKKETKVIAYVVICLTLVVIGVSYAMFLQVNKNTDNQVVETGSLVITYQNGNGEALSEGDIVTSSECLEPMSDDEASIMNDCTYKLNILNRGTLPASYKLIIYNNVEELPGGGTFVDHSLIRLGLKKGDASAGLSVVGNYTLAEIKHTKETEQETAQNNIRYVLDEGVLEAGADITYSVQAWLNEELATRAVSGQYVYLKLEVNSVVSENAGIGNEDETLFDALSFFREKLVTSGEGIYEVSHNDAEITYTDDTTAINNLKQTEYRYAGSNPNNYVKFNNELWRIIGLVNTPEGQRVKIIRSDPIGNYLWDTSESSVNMGYGINEWSQADLMTLLNNGAYYNRTSGTCYNGNDNATTSCDFSSNGLTEEAKEMIDTITWNTGTYDSASQAYTDLSTINFYSLERSNHLAKQCDENTFCNDNVERKTTWKGQVGLISASDYGYATSGNRSVCLNSATSLWPSNMICAGNDWIFSSSGRATMTVVGESAHQVFVVNGVGAPIKEAASSGYPVIPVVHLKQNIKIKSGTGEYSVPYELGM